MRSSVAQTFGWKDGAMSEDSSRFAHGTLDRRHFLAYFSAAGLSGTLLPGVLWSGYVHAQGPVVTKEMIAAAEKIAGLEFTDEEREMMARSLNRLPRDFEEIRKVPLPNSVPPAFRFDPVVPGMAFDTARKPFPELDGPVPDVPEELENLAFWTVADLARAIKARKISSLDLTTMYLGRLKRCDPILKCVVTFTEDLALEQARRADAEIAAGYYRGPLHGIPWGAKDLLAKRGHPTTWGAMPYKEQVIDEDATVVTRLEEAGAVLIAKLALGALAMGDVWFGGRTNNPWDPQRGSSGSSAGPGAATAAGCVGFAIGSETNGSITSPSTVNGVCGLRPTFGRVSRHGAMALAWTMDKLGPMCRSAEDCALVFNAIHGPDGKDLTVKDLPFNWDPNLEVTKLRVGYVEESLQGEGESRANLRRALDTLRSIGINPVPITLPALPVSAMAFILTVEAAAAFDDLTRSNQDDLLVRQDGGAWPNIFRRSRMVPAVEYIQANRVRTLLMEGLAKVFEEIDFFITPTSAYLMMTNLSGHPQLCIPSGFTDDGIPTSVSFIGQLYSEAKLLAVAKAFQDVTDYHKKHPAL